MCSTFQTNDLFFTFYKCKRGILDRKCLIHHFPPPSRPRPVGPDLIPQLRCSTTIYCESRKWSQGYRSPLLCICPVLSRVRLNLFSVLLLPAHPHPHLHSRKVRATICQALPSPTPVCVDSPAQDASRVRAHPVPSTPPECGSGPRLLTLCSSLASFLSFGYF